MTTRTMTAFESVEERVQEACPLGAKLFKWGLRKTWAEGGEDPFEKIWAYASDEEKPHWHYITTGLADPAKVDEEAGSTASGCGYELTFRLLRDSQDEEETEAPTWPVMKLQEMGWGILKSHMSLDAGHYLRRRSVITGGEPSTELQGYYLVKDPGLAPTTCASGEIAFLQLIGLTDEELARCEAGEPDQVEADLRQESPLGITDLDRTSPACDEVDLLRLGELQKALMGHCLPSLPPETTSFSLSATKDGAVLEVEAEVQPKPTEPFMVGSRAEATLRRIFLLYEAAGTPLAGLTAEMKLTADGSWSQAMEFTYPD